MKKLLAIFGLLISMIDMHAKSSNVYLGPEVFYFDLNSKFKGITVEGSKCFFGLKFGYEYVHPAVVYFGIDFLVAAAAGVYDESIKGRNIPLSTGRTAFVDYELKLGYPIISSNNLITLFLCQGTYVFGTGSEDHYFDETNSYLGGGVRYRYAYSSKLSHGINIKIYGSIIRDQKWKFYEEQRETHPNSWGGEVGIPIICCFGCNNRGNFSVEPYFLRLDFRQAQNIYGTRFLFGYKF